MFLRILLIIATPHTFRDIENENACAREKESERERGVSHVRRYSPKAMVDIFRTGPSCTANTRFQTLHLRLLLAYIIEVFDTPLQVEIVKDRQDNTCVIMRWLRLVGS